MLQTSTTDHQILSPRPPEFRLYLQEELIRRCKKNPRFSLRAFARTLDVEASALSKILNGKRSLTAKMLHRMCTQLGLAADEVTRYEQTLSAARAPRRRLAKATDDFAPISADVFNAVADWYHYAILELATVESFSPTPEWVAGALGIELPVAREAIERLTRLGLIEILPDGGWRLPAGQLTTTGHPFTTAAFRKLQKQILAQAAEALETVPLDERDQSSITMAVSKKKLGEAKERIRSFRRELCAFLQDETPHDEVYQLSIALFPVSRINGALGPALADGVPQ